MSYFMHNCMYKGIYFPYTFCDARLHHGFFFIACATEYTFLPYFVMHVCMLFACHIAYVVAYTFLAYLVMQVYIVYTSYCIYNGLCLLYIFCYASLYSVCLTAYIIVCTIEYAFSCLHVVCMSSCITTICKMVYAFLAYFVMHLCMLFACRIACTTEYTFLAYFVMHICMSCCMYNWICKGLYVPRRFCNACLHVFFLLLLLHVQRTIRPLHIS